ncbi:hypothetical protein SPRG_04043 [Saprolegnia parasitica CBS 223.65]|uniref:EF-hand domain-containing protein n=1 Tax=Saprolegnia parasitica (strain CBS 223.65) TaxID=695850 RepID=A0A067CLM8_SAPPC|nr:hypothetical protein SPRG_04043 [Saprolegnia parasitica CBS 223.65]KDO31428.1 hypothetical protein SPRG_04043 [Saprolegnia parasitica CBS 223.65]|eukprot:XP_012198023.1 hypothetical protein SPRG_04043 [Saprolegnia parasitica CBS 223.65]
MRSGLGVLLASAFMTQSSDPQKLWAVFPEWYILGGVSFVAVSCVIATGRNVGATLCQVFQQKLGITLAFAFNALLFYNFQPRLFHSQSEVDAALADGTLLRVTQSFSGEPYMVNNRDFYTVLPFMMGFNALILILPFASGTRKFAMVNNLFFALTVVSPNDYKDPTRLKAANNTMYQSETIVWNLFIYMCLGLIGVALSFLVAWIPYPLFAIRNLQAETLAATETIAELLRLMVDAYCFKKKHVDQMHFLRVKLQRKFELATAKKDAMTSLLQDAWWEQCIGLASILHFKKTVVKPYITLYASLLNSLKAMSQAMRLERYDRLHRSFILELQPDICAVQVHAMALLQEISHHVHAGHTQFHLEHAEALERHVDHLLARFHATQTALYTKMHATPPDVEGTMPLHLFVFALESLAGAMLEFPEILRLKNHNTTTRMHHFVLRSLQSFVDPAQYTSGKLQIACKVWVALLLASLVSVYVFGFASTTATTIAFIMGNQIGGSFGISLLRAVGVVAGVIHRALVVALRNTVLFVWTTMSMYVKWKGGLDAYAGLVSAFIAAGILLPDDMCPAPGSLTSYANIAQMTLGVLLIVSVELLLWPSSAFILVRKNVQKHLSLVQGAFTILFEHSLKSEGAMDPSTLEKMRVIVQTTLPGLLAEQEVLRKEAMFEPRLWRLAFSQRRYDKVIETCEQLLVHTMILYKVVLWFQHQRPQDVAKRVSTSSSSITEDSVFLASPREAWTFSTEDVGAAIHDTFDTLHVLFGSQFWYADVDQAALFSQMKEAFRGADTDRNGVLDCSDVKGLLLRIFEQSGAVPLDALDQYVADFMDIVDPTKSGSVSFPAFMQALENGLLLEVEMQPKAKRLDSIQVVVDASPLLTPSSCEVLPPMDIEIIGGVSHAYDILDVETCSLLDATTGMRHSFAAWVLEARRFQGLPMEELLLLNSLISGVSGIATNLALLEETTVQP